LFHDQRRPLSAAQQRDVRLQELLAEGHSYDRAQTIVRQEMEAATREARARRLPPTWEAQAPR
jgi:hypothetical protein